MTSSTPASDATPASERVREAWSALPGEEHAVDYPVAPLMMQQVLGNDLPPELDVEFVIRTPDGLTMSVREVQSYEPADQNGEIVGWDFQAAETLAQMVSQTMLDRIRRELD